MASVVALLCLPDATACRYAVQMAQHLLDLCIADVRFVVTVAKEAFTAALSVLLQQEAWTVGIEWDLIEFLLDVFLMLVMGEGRQPIFVSGGSGAVGTSDCNTSMCAHAVRSDWPPRILMSVSAVVTMERIAQLEQQLRSIMQRRKRRGVMKDFITELVAVVSGSNSTSTSAAAGAGMAADGTGTGTAAAATGSLLSVAGGGIPLVLDVRHRLVKRQCAHQQPLSLQQVSGNRTMGSGGGEASFNLANLFGD